MKPILCLSFDGVIHSYTSGWKGADIIPDPPVPNAINTILEYSKHFTVAIHSSRFNVQNFKPNVMSNVRDWLVTNGIPWDRISINADWSTAEVIDGMILLCATKPSAFLTLDDRTFTFTGSFPSVSELLDFKPWNCA